MLLLNFVMRITVLHVLMPYKLVNLVKTVNELVVIFLRDQKNNSTKTLNSKTRRNLFYMSQMSHADCIYSRRAIARSGILNSNNDIAQADLKHFSWVAECIYFVSCL